MSETELKDRADYSLYECPYSHVEKECGHELHGPQGYQDTYSVWCQCGFRGPVFYLDPDELGLKLKARADQPRPASTEAEVEAVTKAILFMDCGSTEDWEDNTELGRAAIEAMQPRPAVPEVWRHDIASLLSLLDIAEQADEEGDHESAAVFSAQADKARGKLAEQLSAQQPEGGDQ